MRGEGRGIRMNRSEPHNERVEDFKFVSVGFFFRFGFVSGMQCPTGPSYFGGRESKSKARLLMESDS